MIHSVEYFRLWRSLGVAALLGVIAGLIVAFGQWLNLYLQIGIYLVVFAASVSLMAKLYVFRPLFVALVAVVLFLFLHQGARELSWPLQIAAYSVGGVLVGAISAWVARPQHFGVAVVLAWGVCVIVGLPLTVL